MTHHVEPTVSRDGATWAVLALAGAGMVVIFVALHSLPLLDFAEYWSAGRLLASGGNPYDLAAVEELERSQGRVGAGLLMWNPPWTLSIVLPFGLVPAFPARLLWCAAQCVAVVASADWAWRLYGGRRDLHVSAWIVASGFVPTFLVVYFGQISGFLLLGIVLCLWQIRQHRDWEAGAATLLLAIKPHLFAFVWLALLLWIIEHRRWRIVLGAAATFLAALAVPMLLRPSLLQDYWITMTETPPSQYYSPTLGTLLRMALGEGHFGLQFLALVPGLVWFLPYWLCHRRTWSWPERMPALVFASFLSTPYGAWPFDAVVLLLPVLRVVAMAPVRHEARWLGLGGNAVAALFFFWHIDFFWWIWLGPVVLLTCLLAHRSASLSL